MSPVFANGRSWDKPQGYRRSKPRPTVKLTAGFQQRIEEILKEDEQAPRKQRHTAMAIFGRLSQEGYGGGYDQVRRFVAGQRRSDRETFIPLSHDPGQRAEADFGHIYVDFPDGRRQVAVLIITWAYSNSTFAISLPSEKVEAILYGSVEAFRWFGCVPKELWWDNPKTVATSILRGRERRLNDHYLALASPCPTSDNVQNCSVSKGRVRAAFSIGEEAAPYTARW